VLSELGIDEPGDLGRHLGARTGEPFAYTFGIEVTMANKNGGLLVPGVDIIAIWFDGLERRLDGREWIACADFTVADIILATVLREIRKTNLIDPYPQLKAHYTRALARAAGSAP
jgi:hypothetical protein